MEVPQRLGNLDARPEDGGSQGWEAVQFTPPDKDGECTMLWKRDAQAWRDKEERDWLRDSRIEEQRRKEEEDSS